MDLEIISLNEVKERQISYDITYRWTLKIMIQMNLFTKQNRLTDIENQIMVTKGKRQAEIN